MNRKQRIMIMTIVAYLATLTFKKIIIGITFQLARENCWWGGVGGSPPPHVKHGGQPLLPIGMGKLTIKE